MLIEDDGCDRVLKLDGKRYTLPALGPNNMVGMPPPIKSPIGHAGFLVLDASGEPIGTSPRRDAAARMWRSEGWAMARRLREKGEWPVIIRIRGATVPPDNKYHVRLNGGVFVLDDEKKNETCSSSHRESFGVCWCMRYEHAKPFSWADACVEVARLRTLTKARLAITRV
jgi:hypothetical protein